jgi:hypothetical protein
MIENIELVNIIHGACEPSIEEKSARRRGSIRRVDVSEFLEMLD